LDCSAIEGGGGGGGEEEEEEEEILSVTIEQYLLCMRVPDI